MGVALDLFVPVVRKTGKGSAYLGACECCGRNGEEIEAAGWRRVYKRENGQHYLSGASGEIYGHHGCLVARFQELISAESLERDGSIYLLPDYAVTKKWMADKREAPKGEE